MIRLQKFGSNSPARELKGTMLLEGSGSHRRAPWLGDGEGNTRTFPGHFPRALQSFCSLGRLLLFDKPAESAGEAWKFLCKCMRKLG